MNSVRRFGGGVTATLELSRGLAARGHDVVLACHPDGELADRVRDEPTLRHAPVAIRAELNPVRAIQLALLLRRERPDVVVADRRKDVKMSAAARLLAGSPPLVHRHGAPSPLRDSALYRWIWTRGVAGVVVNSRTMRDVLRERTPWIREIPLRVIHNGKDLSRFGPSGEARREVRRELGLEPDAFVAVYHGVLQDRKNIDVLLRAAAPGRSDDAGPGGVVPAVAAPTVLSPTVLVVGDGPARAELERVARDAATHALFTGHRDDVPRLLAAADAAVLLSSAEGFSNAVLEAMATGLPVIASDTSSHPEQVRDGIDGILVPPGDVSAVATALGRLRARPAEARAMGDAARERTRDHFSVGEMARRYEAFLEEVAAGAGRGRRRHGPGTRSVW